MSDVSKKVHSLIFTKGSVTKNTYDDWLLIPSSRPVIKFPEVDTHFVKVNGADGQIDETELLSGRPVFSMRQDTIEFYVEGYKPGHDWYTLISEIANFLHGQSLQMTLEDDPNYYYTGRWAIDQVKTNQSWSVISLAYILYPFKHAITGDATSL